MHHFSVKDQLDRILAVYREGMKNESEEAREREQAKARNAEREKRNARKPPDVFDMLMMVPFTLWSPAERKEVEEKVSAWRDRIDVT